MQIPILFLGDSPSISGGLSRIGRDLAILASRMEEFRVGYLGRGGLPKRKLPFMQYAFPESDQWGELWLEEVWKDFAGDEKGVVFSIWDPSRLLWLADPNGMPNEQWLRQPPFRKWGYFPVDAEGPGERLTALSAAAVAGYDRVLGYGIFGSGVLGNTLSKDIDWLPHGINMDIFQPRDPVGVKVGMRAKPDSTWIGCVMTNQERKDWGLAFDVIRLLKQAVPNLCVWCKTDSLDRHWDFRALAVDFGVRDVVMVDDSTCSDTAMSYMYSTCDLTFLPSLGEGFGYPIVESLACGTPCVHGNYAGGAELIPKPEWLVNPVAYRFDTRHDCKRPVYNAADWFDAIMDVLHVQKDKEFCRGSVAHLNWSELYTVWQRWFREGLK